MENTATSKKSSYVINSKKSSYVVGLNLKCLAVATILMAQLLLEILRSNSYLDETIGVMSFQSVCPQPI